jgi:tetratricopeptide (TPR) repeat protein/transcriptional regulator with XRE-family HTH domain
MPRSVKPNGDLIRSLRVKKGYNQEDLAAKAGFTNVRTVQRAEKGDPLYFSSLELIATALEIEPELLIAGGTIDLELVGGASILFGREAELKFLSDSWQDPSTRVVSIVAWGGAGKTTLVKNWTNSLVAENWPEHNWAFGRTFGNSYSAGRFLEDALRFFGHERPNEEAVEERVKRLAPLVAAQNTLLILDGLEALQRPPTVGGHGQLDPAMQLLLTRLLTQRWGGGLCVITTRWPLAVLKEYGPPVAREMELSGLSESAGAELLFHSGAQRVGHLKIQDTDAANNPELLAASRDCAGHPLSLQLLGSFLGGAHNGDIQRRDRVRLEQADNHAGEGPAFRVMAAYESWLGSGEAWSVPLAILRLMGLFDGPADAGCLAALRNRPAIEGLTERLVDLDDTAWSLAVNGAGELGLLTVEEGERPALDRLVTHRLVREYFATQLATRFPDAASEAHGRLYEHLRGAAAPLPDNLEEMGVLYQAMTHGCKGGRHDEVFRELYSERVVRDENKPFNLYGLGAFAEDLAALSSFFETPYTKLSAHLNEADHGRVLLVVGFELRALNRMDEAETTLRQSRDVNRRTQDWKHAALAASCLGELHFVQGVLATAVRDVSEAIELADRSEHLFWRMVVRTTLGEILHHCGSEVAARSAFRDAEAMQAKLQPERPLLHSWWGYRYCELLLDECENLLSPREAHSPTASDLERSLECSRALRERAQRTLEWARKENWPLGMGLDLLTIGRTWMLDAVVESLRGAGTGERPPALLEAERRLNESIGYLEKSHERIWLPRGLLARAALRRLLAASTRKTCPDEHAHYLGLHAKDLANADEIAARGSMAICRIEGALEKARLHLDLGDFAGAVEMLDRAQELIDRTKLRYTPHEPEWAVWSPPDCISPYKSGEVVGCTRRNAEIARLRVAIATTRE